MSWTTLNDLPVDHPLRNTPLIEIGARYRWKDGKTWKEVLPSYKIANHSFNQLDPGWTTSDIWEALAAPLTPSKEVS